MQPFLSIVIPAYNEVSRLPTTLDSIRDYLEQQSYTAEIIVVDDGSKDGTSELVLRSAQAMPGLRLEQLPYNQGKGAAVKRGMLAAQGEVRLFMDADGSTSITELGAFLAAIQDGFAIAVGSRLAAGAVKKVKQNLFREVLGWVFRTVTRLVMNTSVLDPQNGFKVFTKDAAVTIFSELQTTGWGFDVEVLMLAKKHALRIQEIPVTWTNDGRSKMRFRHMVIMLIDLAKIRIRSSTSSWTSSMQKSKSTV